MHGERIGFGQTPMVALSYLMVSAILFACSKLVIVDSESKQGSSEPMPELNAAAHSLEPLTGTSSAINA